MNIPQKIRHIHLIAICGTGMGSLALLLQSRGFVVTGSDQNVYPPMSTELEKNGIKIFEGFAAENLMSRASLDKLGQSHGSTGSPCPEGPELVIVGNAVSKDNQEVIAMIERKIPYLSMPQAISHFFLQNKRSVVVSGTHGKTTTSAILSHLLSEIGADPSFLYGGILQGERETLRNYRLGDGDLFVIEGDEYDTAFFDKGPKFLHYQPFYTIITSLEFDHADIYRDLDHLASSFEALVKRVNPAGYLLYCADYERLSRLAHSVIPAPREGSKAGIHHPVHEESQTGSPPPVSARGGDDRGRRFGPPRDDKPATESYGFSEKADWRIDHVTFSSSETRFELFHNGQKVFSFQSPLAGSHNVLNAVAAIALLHHLGYAFEEIQRGLLTFAGVKRRQEVCGVVNDIVVIDDFAHHPTAVRETIDAIKKKYAGHTLWAVFEPRSNTSRRAIFQEEFAEAFDGADYVILADVFEKKPVNEGPKTGSPPSLSARGGDDILNVQQLARDISDRGVKARHVSGVDKIVACLAASVRPPSTILIMSNGGFGGIQEKLLKTLGGNR